MELDYGFSGRTLDRQRNNFDFYKSSLNQNQELFDSRYVAEEEEEEEDDQGFRIVSHEFHRNHEEKNLPGHRLFHGGVGGTSQMKRSNLSSSVQDEYAPRMGEKMGEVFRSQHQELRRRQSRLGLRNFGGEIVEVQGGHIVRSTGRKDRHSKVCTSKGPRDRRVRLSAHTAIQFYDVQDRLGYDRPSKAVDWLFNKAKAAIDELAELPAWQPTTATNSTSIFSFEQNPDHENTSHHEVSRFDEQPNGGNLSFLPPSFNSDSIADTIKTFFPMGATSTTVNSNTSGMQFHQSFPQPDFLSNSSNQSQDLRLSLQSFRDPILHHHQQNEQGNTMILDGSGWPERVVGWSGSGSGSGDAVSGGFVFNSPPTQTPRFVQTLLSQTTNNHLFNNNSHRGTLQSSYTPSIRAWIDQPPFAGAAIDHTSSMSGFTTGVGGFSGFLIPARIQGEQEEHGGISDKPSSASSDSRH